MLSLSSYVCRLYSTKRSADVLFNVSGKLQVFYGNKSPLPLQGFNTTLYISREYSLPQFWVEFSPCMNRIFFFQCAGHAGLKHFIIADKVFPVPDLKHIFTQTAFLNFLAPLLLNCLCFQQKISPVCDWKDKKLTS